jgi:hypothetical protein
MKDKFGEDLVLGDIVEIFVYDADNNKTKIKCKVIDKSTWFEGATKERPNTEVATPSEDQAPLKLSTPYIGFYYFFSYSNQLVKVGHDSDQGKCNHKFIPMFNGVCCKFCGTYK